MLKVMELENNEYLIGVLAAEADMSHHDEALKAQAAACFTYFVRREGSDLAEHGGASVCTSSSSS